MDDPLVQNHREQEALEEFGDLSVEARRESSTMLEVLEANDARDVVQDAVRSALQGKDADPFLQSLKPEPDGVYAEGSEAAVVELQPTSELIRDPDFRSTLEREIRENAGLREKLAAEMGAKASELKGEALTEKLLTGLPENFVVKFSFPEGGSWDAEWGLREFDAPAYVVEEIGDGVVLVLQEKLAVAGSIQELEPELKGRYQILDQLGQGQIGIDRFGNKRLHDYGAVGLVGEDDTMRALTAAADYADEADDAIATDAAEQEQNEANLSGMSGLDLDLSQRRQGAVAGESSFWSDDTNRLILEELLNETDGAGRVEEESIGSVACSICASAGADFDNLDRYEAQVREVLKVAKQEDLLS